MPPPPGRPAHQDMACPKASAPRARTWPAPRASAPRARTWPAPRASALRARTWPAPRASALRGQNMACPKASALQEPVRSGPTHRWAPGMAATGCRGAGPALAGSPLGRRAWNLAGAGSGPGAPTGCRPDSVAWQQRARAGRPRVAGAWGWGLWLADAPGVAAGRLAGLGATRAGSRSRGLVSDRFVVLGAMCSWRGGRRACGFWGVLGRGSGGLVSDRFVALEAMRPGRGGRRACGFWGGVFWVEVPGPGIRQIRGS